MGGGRNSVKGDKTQKEALSTQKKQARDGKRETRISPGTARFRLPGCRSCRSDPLVQHHMAAPSLIGSTGDAVGDYSRARDTALGEAMVLACMHVDGTDGIKNVLQTGRQSGIRAKVRRPSKAGQVNKPVPGAGSPDNEMGFAVHIRYACRLVTRLGDKGRIGRPSFFPCVVVSEMKSTCQVCRLPKVIIGE